MEKKINEKNNNKKEENDFYKDEYVDVINTNDGTVSGGKIISIKDDIMLIKNLKTNKEEQYKKNDNSILKQWKPGRPFLIFNRLDIQLIKSNIWVEGFIININNDKKEITIRYLDKNLELKEENISQNSKRISEIGKFSKNNTNNDKLASDQINNKLFKNRKFVKLNNKQEIKFRQNISNIQLLIKDTKKDGNCMFRAISDQVYGTEENFNLIRQKCMDYISLERDFFEEFIEGGKNFFDEYINLKRKNRVWGDDIELQALSELYNRPIEIYSNSIKPLRTFHESKINFKRDDNNNKNYNIIPIRLSYHGKNHYNSIIPKRTNVIEWKKYRDNLIKLNNGEYENKVLNQIKMDKKNKKNFEYDENIKKFFKEKNKNLDDIIDDFILDDDEEIMNNVIQMSLENKTNNNLNNNFQNKVNNNTQNKINNNIQNKINNNIPNKINNNTQNKINNNIQNKINNNIPNKINNNTQNKINNNIQNKINNNIPNKINNNTQNKINNKTQNKINNNTQLKKNNNIQNKINNNIQNKKNNNIQNKKNNNIQNKINNNIQNTINNENDLDYYSIPSIQIALEYGFSLDDAIMAYSIYGNNQELILDYLYSMKE